ncbi:unnamed protein product, partial [Sphagnum compactum]
MAQLYTEQFTKMLQLTDEMNRLAGCSSRPLVHTCVSSATKCGSVVDPNLNPDATKIQDRCSASQKPGISNIRKDQSYAWFTAILGKVVMVFPAVVTLSKMISFADQSDHMSWEAMGDSLGTYVQHGGGAGLVYNVTEYLFGHGINIENLETHTEE